MPIGEWYVETALARRAREDRALRFKENVPLNMDAFAMAAYIAQLEYFER